MEQENLYLLASEGERHEDAIPDGVYTLDGLKALKYIPIDQNWDDIISEAGDKWLYFYIIDNGQIDDEYQATEEEKEKIMCGDHDKDWLEGEFGDFMGEKKIVKISINEGIPRC